MLEKILLIWLALAIMIWVVVAGVLLEKHIDIVKDSLESDAAMSLYTTPESLI